LLRSPWLVLAVQCPQHVRYRALHPERDPGDSLRPQLRQGGGADGFRIRLDGDFRVFGEAEGVADLGQDRAELARREQCRGAAAEEHSAYGGLPGGQHASREADLLLY